MANQPFQARYIAGGTWIVSGEGCDCYLVEGDREALMIDAGMATANIRAFAQGLTDRPLKRVVNTHSHFDHTGGNGFFDEVLATPQAARSLKNTMGDPPDRYPLDYRVTPIADGDVLDLGGRRLRVLELNCHSPGDVALLDLDRRLLFTGDEVESGQVLLLPGYAEEPGQIHAKPAATVESCLRTMERLAALRGQFDALCPAHNGSPLDPVYLDWFIALCRAVLDGQEGTSDCSSPSFNSGATHFPYPNAGYRRAVHKGASLVYCRALLRDADLVNASDLPPATPLHLISSYFARQ